MAPKLFVFLGRSGCGKGTQCALLSDYLKEKEQKAPFYVSTGDQFRKLIGSDTYTAREVKTIVDEGNFVPSFLASMMWANVIATDYTENAHMIIDGSPRTLVEKAIFDTMHYFYGEKKVFDFESVNIVFMNVSKEWAKDRLLGRARADDINEAIEKRMYWFEKFVASVIEAYKTDAHVKFFEINGEQPIEDVHKEIVSKLGL
ncbi:MAG TPA: nucleoside monophosphate kinase [Candidatus Paceibacterota bacterium]|nr:nucleoside monophosphate kinase [Candidatus Paceibacterota bacterium]